MANLSARERKATFGRTHIHVRRTTWDRVDYPLHPFVKSSRVPSCHVRARRPCVRRSASLIVHRLLVFAALTSAPWRLSLVSEASIRPRRQCDFVFGLRSIHGLHLITSQQHFSTFRSRSSPRPPTFSCSPSLHCCVHAVKNTTIPQGRKQYQIPLSAAWANSACALRLCVLVGLVFGPFQAARFSCPSRDTHRPVWPSHELRELCPLSDVCTSLSRNWYFLVPCAISLIDDTAVRIH